MRERFRHDHRNITRYGWEFFKILEQVPVFVAILRSGKARPRIQGPLHSRPAASL